MKTSLFDFELPESLIATHPVNPRDAARMLVVDGLRDMGVRDLPSFLKPGDVMVFNDTKVIPARLFGKRGDAAIEILLHKAVIARSTSDEAIQLNQEWIASPTARNDECLWQCFARPAKKLKVGNIINVAENFTAEVMEKRDDGQVVLKFIFPSPLAGEGWGGGAFSNGDTPPPNLPPQEGEGLYRMLTKHGHMPLPPYIERADNTEDKERYQTVYAREEGSVAAPTAGLHFTPELLAAIDAIGVKRVHVTLHVGGGTFLPVKVEDTKDHIMHSEYAQISSHAAATINAAKQAGGRVIAVGTTALRTLESAAFYDLSPSGRGVRAFAEETSIFITPGYQFKAVDMLLTNFHLPKSTLFMLVSAFSGLEVMKTAYAHAIRQKYRFYSYGDACLLFRQA